MNLTNPFHSSVHCSLLQVIGKSGPHASRSAFLSFHLGSEKPCGWFSDKSVAAEKRDYKCTRNNSPVAL